MDTSKTTPPEQTETKTLPTDEEYRIQIAEALKKIIGDDKRVFFFGMIGITPEPDATTMKVLALSNRPQAIAIDTAREFLLGLNSRISAPVRYKGTN